MGYARGRISKGMQGHSNWQTRKLQNRNLYSLPTVSSLLLLFLNLSRLRRKKIYDILMPYLCKATQKIKINKKPTMAIKILTHFLRKRSFTHPLKRNTQIFQKLTSNFQRNTLIFLEVHPSTCRGIFHYYPLMWIDHV